MNLFYFVFMNANLSAYSGDIALFSRSSGEQMVPLS